MNKKLIIFAISISAVIVALFTYSYIRTCSIKITFLNSKPVGVFINDKKIDGINETYFMKTDYGPLDVKIYYDFIDEPTVLEIFHTNNWYKSRVIIELKDNILEIEHREIMSKYIEGYDLSINERVELGGKIRLGWL